jgi:signal transduction histidine kinase/ligand-binding sensor domain-containing protein
MNELKIKIKRILWRVMFLITTIQGLFLPTSFSQNANIVFTKIKGLPNDMINEIIQDKQGYLWVATWGGLCRYDGYEFKVFKTSEEDTSTLWSNGILNIDEDNYGKIWIACNTGLCAYIEDKDCFVRFSLKSDDINATLATDLNCIFIDKNNILWIGTYYNGLFTLDLKTFNNSIQSTPKFKQYKNLENIPSSLSSNYIRAIFQDKQSNIWINASNAAIDKYNKKNSSFEHYPLLLKGTKITSNIIYLLCEDDNGLFWIGTRGDGLISWDRSKNDFHQFKYKSGANSISSNYVMQVQHDIQGHLWICTDGGGISIYDKKRDQFSYCKNEPSNSFSLASNAVYCTFMDQAGVRWIGTYNAGLNKYEVNRTCFRHYKPDPYEKNSLSNRSVLALLEDKDGNLWIGTDGGGLNFMEKATGKFKHYVTNQDDTNTIGSNAVVCLLEDKEGNIWIGTYAGGLNCFDRKKETFKRYFHNSENDYSISHNDIWALYEDSKQNLWIGTISGTLNLFDRKNNQFYHYKNNPGDPESFTEAYTNGFYEDSKNNLWIATIEGLEMVNLNSIDFSKRPYKIKFNHFTHKTNINSISSNDIYGMCEDASGNLWFGSENGILNKLDLHTHLFSHYTETNGLKYNGIRALVIDDENNIWITSVNGLWRYSIDKNTFIKYDVNDGLQDLNFSRACIKTKNGSLCIGGSNGFNIFNPKQIVVNHIKPKVAITGLSIFNNIVDVNELVNNRIIIDKPINEASEIKLTSKENYFSFQFAALDFTIPEKNLYAYKMEGFDYQWHTTTAKNRSATYTNLDPGKYIFTVKASNNDGVWNETGKQISIIVLPSWWETLWFRFLIIILILSIIYYVYYLRVSFYRSNQKELKQQVSQRTEQLEQTYEHIKSQAEELRLHSLQLKEINEILLEKQKLIQIQSEQLKETNNSLLKLNAAKDKLFSIIAHDLRNPFNVVTGFSDLLLNGINNIENDKLIRYVEIIHNSAKSGNDLLANLLQWSRSQTGRMPFDPVKLNLSALAEETIILLGGESHRKEIKISQNISSNIFVLADAEMIKTIFRNLLSNAIKFTYNQGEININSAIKDSIVEISVADNGTGISEGTIDLLFRIDKTVSSKGTSNEQGTGLGLILCKEFVEKHNGHIWVESTIGEGSKFIFTLSLA